MSENSSTSLQKRKRIALACDTCRASKRQCDGSQPCQVCTGRRIAQLCYYTSKKGVRKRHQETSHHPQESTHQIGPENGRSDVASDPAAPENGVPTPSNIVDCNMTPSGQMFHNAIGENVYLNSTAGLSFVQFLKTILRERLGPSPFTNEPSSYSVHDAMGHRDEPEDIVLTEDTKREFVHYFHVSTVGFLEICECEEIDYLLSSEPQLQASVELTDLQIAILYVIFAIGAQARTENEKDKEIANSTFARARKIAFQEYLENPSIDLIRVFLLMAFYMIGDCRRHAAVMHIGVAATTAVMLGLHDTDQYNKFPPDQAAVRWQVYQGLIVMDVINATLLGRHILTPGLTAGRPQINLSCTKQEVAANNTIVFDLCYFVHESINKIAVNGRLSQPVTEQMVTYILQRGSKWKEDRENVTTFTKEMLTSWSGRTSAIRSLHNACIYYHTLVLVCRPMLIDSFIVLIQKSSVESTLNISLLTDEMAKTCLEACINAADMCFRAFDAKFLVGNICHLIRPLLFEVGLILGFVLAVYPRDSNHVEDAFRKVRKILKHFAKMASLSKVFYDILSSLWEAIMKRRMELSMEKGRKGATSVESMISFDIQDSATTATTETIQVMTESAGDEAEPSALQNRPGADVGSDVYFNSPEWQFLIQQYSAFMPSHTLANVFDGL